MSKVFTIAVGLLLLSAAPGTAYAYIDPGVAGMVLQAIIGGAVGALFVVRHHWQKVKRALLPSAAMKEPNPAKHEDD